MKLSSWLWIGCIACLGVAHARAEVTQEETERSSKYLQLTAITEDSAVLSNSEEGRQKILHAKIASWMRQAAVAMRTREFTTADAFYLQVLSVELKPEERRQVLLDMVKLYEASNEPAKQAATLEKLAEAFPDDASMPQILIKLGILYRELGLHKLAMTRFYSVLNYALKIDPDKIDDYKQYSLRAQMEIADTFFVLGEYSEAVRYYKRLKNLDMSPEDRSHVLFQDAYSYYLLKDDPKAIAGLEAFIRTYPENPQVPEAMFTLAASYTRGGRASDGTRTVLDLLKRQQDRAEKKSENWAYWQRKAGNQLANDLFNQNDFSSALAIYQAMLPLGEGPAWVWQVQYQIGLCYERLALIAKAAETYQGIVDWPEKERTPAMDVPSLKAVYDMAKWRVENLRWQDDTREKLQKLLDKSSD